jgi:hypothetical protein
VLTEPALGRRTCRSRFGWGCCAPAGRDSIQVKRIVLVTTTVSVPEVLRLYRALDTATPIIVTGDERTPDHATRAFVESLGNARYLDRRDQEALGYRCSTVLGWNTVGRRNIAILEAMKLRPDVILTIDDDNIPVGPAYFAEIREKLNVPFRGLSARGADGWFNVGDLLDPPVYHRGFPYDRRQRRDSMRLAPIHDAEVGVIAGLWAGDPDIDAIDRIVDGTRVRSWSALVRDGVVLSKGCYCPFNSQNTAFRFELSPWMMVWHGVGRYDDVWGSYAAQRLLRETPYHVHYGTPMVWQERNPHSPWKNVRDELHGMEHTAAFVRALEEATIDAGEPVERLRELFQRLRGCDAVPVETLEAGLAWCDDVREVMRA